MKNIKRTVARLAGILIFALSPMALAEEVAPIVAAKTEESLAVANGLMNLAVYDALKSAGADEDKARAAAQAAALPERNQLATKADIAELRAETKAEIAKLESRLFRAGAVAAGLILSLLAGLFAMIVGVWRKIAELAEKMPPPAPAH